MSLYLEKISETILVKSYVIICFSSFVFCYLIIIGASYLFNKNLRKDELAIQSAHNGFVPRLGGYLFDHFIVYVDFKFWIFIGESIAESIRWANDILSNYHPASFLSWFC